MARVTVEDCVDKIPNRFELVLLASQRARAISSGAQLLIDRDNDKNPVVALREIAGGEVTPDELREAVIHGMQRHVEVDESEEDDLSLIEASREVRAAGEVSPEEFVKALAEIGATADNAGDGAPPAAADDSSGKA